MTDQPFHHTPDHYTWLAQYTAKHDIQPPLVWGHDHDGAYRQLPLDDPSIAYVLLLTPQGPTLWHHHVLLFGSAASVWAYNRFGDMLTAIARAIACVPVVHYVDDYGSIEPSTLAESGFTTFKQVNSLLGFHMKPSKRQPPEPSHRIQGDQPNTRTPSNTTDDTRTSPQTRRQMFFHHYTPFGESRQGSTTSLIRQSLFEQRLPLGTYTELTDSTTQHPTTLSPRRIPLRPTPDQHTIIYTDFFYKDGDRQLRLHQLLEDPDLIKPSSETTNGWAAVVFHPHSTKPLAFNGAVPPRLLKHFASNKAFIYFLEAWAAIITPVLVQPLLTPTYIQLCDDDAATHPIIKGSGKHMPLNNLLGAHWTWHNRHSLKQTLHRVPTHANIADPFSREDFSIAKQLQWRILEPPTKSHFAHNIGFSQDPFIQQFQHLAFQKFFPRQQQLPGTDKPFESNGSLVLVTLDHFTQ